MINPEILLLAIGILSSASMVISAIAIRRPRLLLFSLITSLLCTVQFGMTGAVMGMTICAIGIARNGLLLAGTKYQILNHWGFLVGFLAASITAFSLLNDWSQPSIWNTLPLLGAITGTVAMFLPKVEHTKIGLIITSSLWLVYEYHAAVYGQMLGETLMILGNSVALFVLVKARRQGIPESEVETVEEQLERAITTSIPVITGKISQIHDTRTRPIPVASSNN